jgi:dolichol-phosphate mannosyltransferase
MNRFLVVVPTYNEKNTIPVLIRSLMLIEGFDLLVIDDGSPDGTAAVIKDIMTQQLRVSLIEREGKLGLGTAYIRGFKWGLVRGYDYFVEMDADGSHDPGTLPSFMNAMGNSNDLVIGSRYLDRRISVVGWDFHRLLLSKFGNFYASTILGLKLSDLTSGFRCYSRKALETLDLDSIKSSGYAFQIEMAYCVKMAGCKVEEIPIIFYERSFGSSKMSKKIIREAVILPWKLRLREFRDYLAGIFSGKKDA